MGRIALLFFAVKNVRTSMMLTILLFASSVSLTNFIKEVNRMMRYIYTFLFAVFFLYSSLFAQITITSADVSAINAVGNVLTNHLDSTTTSINIGSPGATSWNFSGLKSDFNTSFTSVTPSSTPYYSDFPTSNVVFKYKLVIESVTADGWQYTTQNSNNYLLNGVVAKVVIDSDEVLTRGVVSPPQLFFPLPFTYNHQWNSSFVITNTTLVNGSPVISITANHTETVIVDAYGPMTMPGGAVLQALRLRRDDRYTSNIYNRTISYAFLTKSGAMLEVSARDTTAPNSGIIQVDAITWRLPTGIVNVRNEDQIPSRYSLSQNYPNPFNPSTTIEYHLPTASHVLLRVYDVLGRGVATLVNENKSAGVYTVSFDASELAGGVYFYRLQVTPWRDGALALTGNYVQTRQMVLLK